MVNILLLKRLLDFIATSLITFILIINLFQCRRRTPSHIASHPPPVLITTIGYVSYAKTTIIPSGLYVPHFICR